MAVNRAIEFLQSKMAGAIRKDHEQHDEGHRPPNSDFGKLPSERQEDVHDSSKEELSKEELKKQVAIIAAQWPGYEDRYNEKGFFADIDDGKITTTKQISEQFRAARMLML